MIIAMLAIVAVVMIAALVVILVFILNRRRKDRRKLYDVPHITPQPQNLDDPIYTGGRDVQHWVGPFWSRVANCIVQLHHSCMYTGTRIRLMHSNNILSSGVSKLT